MGRILEPVLQACGAHLIALEKSEAMANLYKAPGDLLRISATDYRFKPCDLIICFLTLMFIHDPAREELIDRLYSSLKRGGAMIIVDKVTYDGYPATIMHRLTLFCKTLTQTPPDQIMNKELSLSGVQRPLNTDHLSRYQPFEFFRFGEFAGWIIVKF